MAVTRKFFSVCFAILAFRDDGTEKTSKAGDVLNIPPGHDAWVVGNEKTPDPIRVGRWTNLN